MSGIIGGAGSKSGVIGTTELDYEEGTWTPVIKMGTTTQSAGQSDGTYTKIGKMVICNASVTSITESGTGNLSCSLPFTSAASPSGLYSTVLVRWGAIDSSPADSFQGFIGHNGAASFEFQLMNEGGYAGAVRNVECAGTFHLYGMSWTYTIA